MAAPQSADGTVGKALQVLDLVASFERPVRFSELEPAAPYPKATLYRLVQTLTKQRMLSHDPERGTYAPGVRLVRLAHSAWAQSSLAPMARQHLDRLSETLGETVHLAQLDHGQVLYVDKRNPAQPVEMFSQAGRVGPAYCTGVGKAMLAHLEPEALEDAIAQQAFHRFTDTTLTSATALREELAEIRTAGAAFDREEHEPGIICVAVPILSGGGRVLGAISFTSTTARTSLTKMEKRVPLLQDTAENIAREADSWRFPDAAPKMDMAGAR